MAANKSAIVKVAKSILNSGKLVAEIVEIVQSQSKTGVSQLQILDGFNEAAQSQGRYAGGEPTLGDSILDSLAANVGKYGKSAYKLSDKQVTVIINDVCGYRKEENNDPRIQS